MSATASIGLIFLTLVIARYVFLFERHRSATPACFWHPSLPSRRSARSADALGLAESACSAVGRGFSVLSSGIINRSALIVVMFISLDVRSKVDLSPDTLHRGVMSTSSNPGIAPCETHSALSRVQAIHDTIPTRGSMGS